MTESKECNKCGITKSLGEFYNNVKKQDGKSAHCKLCAKAYSQKWHKKNYVSMGRVFVKKDAELIHQAKERNKKNALERYYRLKKENEICAKPKKQRKTVEEIKATQKLYRHNNRGKINAQKREKNRANVELQNAKRLEKFTQKQEKKRLREEKKRNQLTGEARVLEKRAIGKERYYKKREEILNYGNNYYRKQIEEVSDRYLAKTFKLPIAVLRQYPELIAAKRLQILIHRKLTEKS